MTDRLTVRCIRLHTDKVVGSVVLDDPWLLRADVVRFTDPPFTRDLRPPSRPTVLYTCPLETWFVDDEGAPLERAWPYDSMPLSSRYERFLMVTEEQAGHLPGWVRLPPKRIIEL